MFPITVPDEFVELCASHTHHSTMLMMIKWRHVIDNRAELSKLKKELAKRKSQPQFERFAAWVESL